MSGNAGVDTSARPRVDVELFVVERGSIKVRVSVDGKVYPIVTSPYTIGGPVFGNQTIQDLAEEFYARTGYGGSQSHYLLCRVLGKIVWTDAMVKAAGESKARLTVRLRTEDSRLAGLPWELAGPSPKPDQNPLAVLRSPVQNPDANELTFGDTPTSLKMLYVQNEPTVRSFYREHSRFTAEGAENERVRQLAPEEDEIAKLREHGYEVKLWDKEVEFAPDSLAAQLCGVNVLHITAHGFRYNNQVCLGMYHHGHEPTPTPGSTLAAGIGRAERSDLRVVTIASCWSAYQQPESAHRALAEEVFLAGVPVVAAFSRPVDDAAATDFLSNFYPLLLDNPLADAVEKTREEIRDPYLDQFTLVVYSADFEGHVLGARGARTAATTVSSPERAVQCGRLSGVYRLEGELVSAQATGPMSEPLAVEDFEDLPTGVAFLVSSRGSVIGSGVDGSVSLSSVDRITGGLVPWVSVDLPDQEALAISDETYPGSGSIRVIATCTEGPTCRLTCTADGITGSEEISVVGAAHAVADRSGYLVITRDHNIEATGSPFEEIAQRLASTAGDVNRLDACCSGFELAVLVVLASGVLRLHTRDRIINLGEGADGTLVRPGPGAALQEVLIRKTDGSVGITTW